MKNALVLAFLAFAVLVPSGLGLKCYVCNNVENEGSCGTGKDVGEEHLKDCNDPANFDDFVQGAKYSFCRKILTTIEFNVNNHTATERVVRKCGYLESPYDETCYYRGGFGGRQRVCSCKTDGCNSAPVSGGSAILLFLGGISAFVAFKQF